MNELPKAILKLDIPQSEKEALFRTLIKRTNEITMKAEADGNTALALKGLDQLSKWAGLYGKDNKIQEPQEWTGLTIDYGNGNKKPVS